MERVLYPHLSTYWTNLQAVLDDYSVSNAQVKADGHKVYGAILVSELEALPTPQQYPAPTPPSNTPRPLVAPAQPVLSPRWPWSGC